LNDDRKASNEKGFLLAAYFHWHNGEHDKAREYAKYVRNCQCMLTYLSYKVMDSQPQFVGAQILMGWIDLTSGRESLVKRSVNYFDKALSNGNKKEIEVGIVYSLFVDIMQALLGKAKFLEMQREYAQALEILNNVIVLFSWFTPALTEKAKLLLMMGDWEQTYETVHRVVSQEGTNIEALRILVLFHLCRESRPSVAAKRMSELIQALDINEPKNPNLFCSVAKPFSRLAGRNPQ
jgi:tetratricopeptide repeat protein 21B